MLSIYRDSRNFGAALMKLGLKRNDCVSVVLPNIVEFSTIMLGILEAGNLIVSGLTVSLYLP